MEVLVLDKNFVSVAVVDAFESLIWTERYIGYGDFELVVPYNQSNVQILREDYYIWMKNSNAVMIIESIEIIKNFDSGTKMTVKGRSLESILERRIIWRQTTVGLNASDNVNTCIKQLITDAIINPIDVNGNYYEARKIPNFIYEDTTNNYILGCTMSGQYTGDNLYSVISEICTDLSIGFKIELNDDNQFVFSLYYGTDRSYNQDEENYVIFSPKFDNLSEINYVYSVEPFKSVTLVAGEDRGVGIARKTKEVFADNTLTGIERRELYTDARDIQQTVDDVTLTDAQYYTLLEQRGYEKLSEVTESEAFEGGIEAYQTFHYGTDFFLGDIVQVEDEIGLSFTVRVSEFIRSQDRSGYSEYPTFEVI